MAERFAAAGFRLFLVGGIVRDLHLGATLDALDFDLTTDARPAQIKELVGPVSSAVWTQGERFGTIGCQVGSRPVEITTHRAEWYGSDSRKPDVVFGDDVDVDLSRRDFTVNAMAVEVPSGRFVDPFDGRTALAELRLETPIDPVVSFSDDPLRILRAARFIARYDLVPVDGLLAAAQSLIDRVSIVSVERIREEYDKLLAAEQPSSGIAFLDAVGAIPHMFASLPADAVPVLAATLDRTPLRLELRRLVTFSFVPPTVRAEQLAALRHSNQDARAMTAVLAGWDRLGESVEWNAEQARRLVLLVGHDRMDDLFDLADVREVSVSELRSAVEELAAAEDLSDLTPAVTGGRIIAELGMEPGPAVGAAMAALTERRIIEGPLTAEAELDWLRGRG